MDGQPRRAEGQRYDAPGVGAFYTSRLTASLFLYHSEWLRRKHQVRTRPPATCHSNQVSPFPFPFPRMTPFVIRTRLVTARCYSLESIWTTLHLHLSTWITESVSCIRVVSADTYCSSCANKVLSVSRFRLFRGFSTAGGLSFDFPEYRGISIVASASCLTI